TIVCSAGSDLQQLLEIMFRELLCSLRNERRQAYRSLVRFSCPLFSARMSLSNNRAQFAMRRFSMHFGLGKAGKCPRIGHGAKGWGRFGAGWYCRVWSILWRTF